MLISLELSHKANPSNNSTESIIAHLELNALCF